MVEKARHGNKIPPSRMFVPKHVFPYIFFSLDFWYLVVQDSPQGPSLVSQWLLYIVHKVYTYRSTYLNDSKCYEL